MKSTILVAIDAIDGFPVVAATTLAQLHSELNEYCGVGDEFDNSGKYIGFEKFESEYYDAFQGSFEYEINFAGETDTVKFKVYEIDFVK